MRTLAGLAAAVTAAVALSGCGEKAAETPKGYAPPPKVGTNGALRGAEAPGPPTVPK
jgi:hypothetical protein